MRKIFKIRRPLKGRKTFFTQRPLAALALAALIGLAPSASATTINFTATDLVDLVSGEDLWRYDYEVSDRTFATDEGFEIFFDPSLYTSLTALASPSPDRDPIILQQPDPTTLPPFDIGIFDVLALADDPFPLGLFSVEFIFLGADTPGSQPFTIYDATFAVIEEGSTTPFDSGPAVPEPATVLLLISGLALVAARARRLR